MKLLCFAFPFTSATIASFDMPAIFASPASFGTLRVLAAGVSAPPESPWHFAHCALNTAAPSSAVAFQGIRSAAPNVSIVITNRGFMRSPFGSSRGSTGVRRQRAIAPSLDTVHEHSGAERRHADEREQDRVRPGRMDGEHHGDHERDEH